MTSASGWRFVVCDSLEKVFADQEPRSMTQGIPLSAFAGETVSFQVAFRPPPAQSFEEVGTVRVEVGGAGATSTVAASADLVPATLVAFEPHDEGWLRDTAGLYPDLLRPLGPDGAVVPFLGQWRAVWFAVTAPAGLDGELLVEVTVRSARTGEVLFTTTVPVRVHPQSLPPLDIVNTQWVHGDGIATYYGVEVFSEEFWRIVERFVGKAAQMGVNSVLTPVWTPPLDTAVGGSRRPVQLVEITDEGGTYRFDFAKLERWMDLCRRQGMRHLEIAHLFTQWGAEHAPAISVRTASGLEQRFGWHTPATDPEYRRLLEGLLPALRTELDTGWGERVIWHISDEPHGAAMLESYRAARRVVDDLLAGCTVVDALSDFDFFSSGLVPTPVVATDALDPFFAAGVSPLWMYYCVAQHEGVANRFIGQPSTRNRVLGSQLFRFHAAGFLHWGFNFYNAHLSTRPIDPFRDTTAGGAFLAGDPFIVYPGDGGEPWESIRFRVFAEAMVDHRAMQALRDLAGDDAVRRIIDPDGALTMTRYSADPDHYRRVRAALTDEIVRCSS